MKTDVAVRAKFTGLTGATQDCSIDAKRTTAGTVDRRVRHRLVSGDKDHVMWNWGRSPRG